MHIQEANESDRSNLHKRHLVLAIDRQRQQEDITKSLSIYKSRRQHIFSERIRRIRIESTGIHIFISRNWIGFQAMCDVVSLGSKTRMSRHDILHKSSTCLPEQTIVKSGAKNSRHIFILLSVIRMMRASRFEIAHNSR